jgi:glycosyltransferase involved in cell wall biosynthesis
MIVNFVYPSSRERTGGVTMLYEFANSLARRGNEVHFIHGPLIAQRVSSVDEISFRFHPAAVHHLPDDLDDPSLPRADVLFGGGGRRLGEPAVIVQGFRLLGPAADALAYRSPTPKVCVASWLVEVGRWYGVPERQLVHVPLGLDHELFAMRTPPEARTIDVAMLYHPAPEKGWDVGRAMLDELWRRRPDLRTTVITLARPPRDPLPDGVLREGCTQRQLVDEVYNRTRVFVQASHHEGFGLTALESMACGATLVTTDCGGSRDYATDGQTAVVVPPGDPIALADAVEALLDDDSRRGRLALAGAASVRKFDWDRSGELLESFVAGYAADPPAYQLPPGEDRSAEFRL